MVWDLRRGGEYSAGLREMNLSGTSSLTITLTSQFGPGSEAPRLFLASVNISSSIITEFMECKNTFISDSLDVKI